MQISARVDYALRAMTELTVLWQQDPKRLAKADALATRQEIPARFLRPLSAELAEQLAAFCKDRSLVFAGSDRQFSPRKLSWELSGLSATQPDQTETQVGPPQRMCVGEDGQPTLQGLKFAEKWGVGFDQVRFEQPAGEQGDVHCPLTLVDAGLVDPGNNVLGIGVAGKDDAQRVRPLTAHRLEKLDTGDSWHALVADDDLHPLGLDDALRLLGIRSGEHFEVVFERPPQGFLRAQFVVDDEHRRQSRLRAAAHCGTRQPRSRWIARWRGVHEFGVLWTK